jgi:hypothetical protein
LSEVGVGRAVLESWCSTISGRGAAWLARLLGVDAPKTRSFPTDFTTLTSHSTTRKI